MGSLLTDIHNKYCGQYKKITREFKVINNDKNGLVQEILEIRNKAAHSHTKGEAREVTKEEVNEALIKLEETFFRLTNISTIISQELKPTPKFH